jgi:type VI secretion system VgrG family protein
MAPIACGPDLSSTNLSFKINGTEFGTVVAFAGIDGISRPYEYLVAIRNKNSSIDGNTIIQNQYSGEFRINRNGNETAFNGIITEFSLVAYDGNNAIYVAKLSPRVSLLSYTTTYRGFENMNVKEVIDRLMSEGGISQFQISSSNSIQKEYIGQYKESNFDFISRLMESNGMHYHFSHDPLFNAEIFEVSDRNDDFEPPNIFLQYIGTEASPATPSQEYIKTLNKKNRLVTSAVESKSYDFKRVNFQMVSKASALNGIGEDYEFIPGIEQKQELDIITKSILESIQAQNQSYIGTSNADALKSGYRFILNDTSGAGLNGTFLLTAVSQGALLVEGSDTCLLYGNEFEAIPETQKFTPPRKTPTPKIDGVMTAKVVGSNFIETDKYGRVKLQFQWDRTGTVYGSPVWVRVATPIASNGRGILFIPELGDEVVVSFLDGNPDYPIVIGSVYNGNNMPPVLLPDNKYAQDLLIKGDTKIMGNVTLTDGKQSLIILPSLDYIEVQNSDLFLSSGRLRLSDDTISVGEKNISLLDLANASMNTSNVLNEITREASLRSTGDLVLEIKINAEEASRISSHNADINALNNSLNNKSIELQNALAALEQRRLQDLAGLGSEDAAIRQNISLEVQALNDKIASLRTNISEEMILLNSQINGLESGDEEIKSSINTLNQSLTSSVDRLWTEIDALNQSSTADIAAIKAELTVLHNEDTRLDTLITTKEQELGTRIRSLEDENRELKSQLSLINSTLNNRISQLESRLGSNITSLEKKVSNNTARISQLEIDRTKIICDLLPQGLLKAAGVEGYCLK